jgi:hypothetical protein
MLKMSISRTDDPSSHHRWLRYELGHSSQGSDLIPSASKEVIAVEEATCLSTMMMRSVLIYGAAGAFELT